MSRTAWLIVIIVALVVLGAGGALLAAHKSSNNSAASTQTNSTADETMKNMDMSKEQPSSSTPSATSSVTIENFAFSPASLTVKKGTSVTWTNKDSATHTVTENDGQSGPDSGDLATGKSYSFTYNTVGTFKYHCAIHPNMTGTVTVTE